MLKTQKSMVLTGTLASSDTKKSTISLREALNKHFTQKLLEHRKQEREKKREEKEMNKKKQFTSYIAQMTGKQFTN